MEPVLVTNTPIMPVGLTHCCSFRTQMPSRYLKFNVAGCNHPLSPFLPGWLPWLHQCDRFQWLHGLIGSSGCHLLPRDLGNIDSGIGAWVGVTQQWWDWCGSICPGGHAIGHMERVIVCISNFHGVPQTVMRCIFASNFLCPALVVLSTLFIHVVQVRTCRSGVAM